jgi:hypothetical protein
MLVYLLSVSKVTPRGPFYACNHTRTNHVLFVYNRDGIPAEHRGCYQALDAQTYQTSSPGYRVYAHTFLYGALI